jgi:hypothetical protein
VSNKKTVWSASGKTILVDDEQAARRDESRFRQIGASPPAAGGAAVRLALSVGNKTIKRAFEVKFSSQFFGSFAPPSGG